MNGMTKFLRTLLKLTLESEHEHVRYNINMLDEQDVVRVTVTIDYPAADYNAFHSGFMNEQERLNRFGATVKERYNG